MESPYTGQIRRLRRITTISGLAIFIFIAITMSLSLLPGNFFIVTYFFVPLSAIVSLGAAFEAEMWQKREAEWRINRTFDTLHQIIREYRKDLDTDN